MVHRRGRPFAALMGATVLLFSVLPGTIAAPAHQVARAKTYTIYLSNTFLGNDWRVQMQNDAKVLAQKPPLAGRVTLKIANTSENTVPAQIASLSSIIETHPDAILLDASGTSGLDAVLTRACNQGILVVSFDGVVSAPCAWKISANWNAIAQTLAQWMVQTLHGKGNIFMDRGQAGVTLSTLLYNGALAVFKKYPGIHVVGTFYSNYALGPEQTGVASLLAAHPKVDGIYTQGYGVGALRALGNAGIPLVPVAAYSYNITTVTCLKLHATCIAAGTPAWISALAMKYAVEALDGKIPRTPQTIYNPTPYFETNKVKIPGANISPIVAGVTAFPNQPDGLFIPVAPPWTGMTPQEALTGKL